MRGTDSAVRLRPAEESDAAFIAWGLDEAAGGLITAMLGRRSQAILAEVVAQPSTGFSYQHTTIAEVDGGAVGMCQGWPHGTPSGTKELTRVAGLQVVRLAVIALLGWPLFSAMDRHDPTEWYLQALAVQASTRGSGVGTVLFTDAIDRARLSGSTWLTLDVDTQNPGAERLYRRLGLSVVSTSPRAPLIGAAPTRRMRVHL